jgi:hypothetical protein
MTNIFPASGHWQNMPLLAQIQASPSCNQTRAQMWTLIIYLKLSLRMQSTHVAFLLPMSVNVQYHCRDVLSVVSVLPFRLLSVKYI